MRSRLFLLLLGTSAGSSIPIHLSQVLGCERACSWFGPDFAGKTEGNSLNTAQLAFLLFTLLGARAKRERIRDPAADSTSSLLVYLSYLPLGAGCLFSREWSLALLLNLFLKLLLLFPSERKCDLRREAFPGDQR